VAVATPSQLQRTLAAQRAELRTLQANAIRGASVTRQQAAQLRSTTLELIRQLKAAGITPGTDAAIARATLDDQALFMALQQQAQFTNAHILNTLVAEVQAAQLQIGAIAVRHAEVMLAQAGHAADALRMVPVRAASNMAAMFRPSSPFNGLKALSAQQIEGIGDTLVQGVVRGYHPMRVAREITQNVVGVPEARAATIARTEIMRAYRTSSTQFYADNMYRVGANGVASGVVTGWVWECSAGSNTCAACYAMSGQTFPADAEMDSHPNCFPSGTVVTGPPVLGSSTRWYEGELVDIKFASGNHLSVTPNHPILTTHGWVAAGLLDEASDVLRCGDAGRAMLLVNPDDHQVPALIEHVAEAVGGASGVGSVAVPTSPEDFHGDGVGSKVSVIRADGLLRHGTNDALVGEKTGELQLVVGDVALAILASLGSPKELVLCPLHSPDGIVSSGSLAGVFGGREGGRVESVGLYLPANRNVGVDEPQAHDVPRYSETVGDGLLGLPGEIGGGDVGQVDATDADQLAGLDPLPLGWRSQNALSVKQLAQALVADASDSRCAVEAFACEIEHDRPVNLSRRSFAGHVYNLQTTRGWYAADGIIVHNCQCMQIHTTVGWDGTPDGEGATTADTLGIEPGEDVFAALSDAEQLAILGPSKYALYSSGKITLKDLVHERHSAEWGTTRSVASRKQALASAAARPA